MPLTSVPADLPRFPPRDRHTSKRDYGRVLVVGGAAGMAGAPALSALAALRSGAGLVELVVPDSVVAIAAGFDPCVMTRGLAADADGGFSNAALATILERAAGADAVAVGPGIGRSAATQQIVLALWEQLRQPAVFDADALWALAQVDRERLARHAGPRVLTPHAGEMQRLLGRQSPGEGVPGARAMLEAAAAALAEAIDAVIVLKGPATCIVGAGQLVHNETGNPGMATAGAGDVLTGVVAALLCQWIGGALLEPRAAARLAAWVHGHAGDIAAQRFGEISLIARDILEVLPEAFKAVVQTG